MTGILVSSFRGREHAHANETMGAASLPLQQGWRLIRHTNMWVWVTIRGPTQWFPFGVPPENIPFASKT